MVQESFIILDKNMNLLPSTAITCMTTALRYAKYDFASEVLVKTEAIIPEFRAIDVNDDVLSFDL